VVFDVAHNPQGIAMLCRTWEEHYPAPPNLVVFGCMADKDAAAMWGALPSASTRLVVPPPRAGAHPLHPAVGDGVRLDGVDDLRLWRALEDVASAGGRALVCGSFFLVAVLRARILRGEDARQAGDESGERADRLDLSDPVPRRGPS
jgi:folylpolyglutamate synthase/dihydropteroate synthase